MKKLLSVSLIVTQFPVAQAGLEPARPFRAKGFSYHYSFRYQLVCYDRIADNLRIYNHPVGDKPSYTNCLWSGLYLNHIEILQDYTFDTFFMESHLSRYSYKFQLRPLLYLVSTHCLKGVYYLLMVEGFIHHRFITFSWFLLVSLITLARYCHQH